MSSTFDQISAALSQGSFADVPDIDAMYEQYRIAVSWRSLRAGASGENRIRELLAGSTIIEKIEVSKR